MFRFSIRELMLVTVVVGLVAGWWIDHRAQTSWRARAGAMQWHLEWEGHEVTWDKTYVTVTSPGTQVPATLLKLSDHEKTPDPAERQLKNLRH